MTDNAQTAPTPDAAPDIIEAAPFSVGTALREARLLKGMSVEDISSRIKFAPRQIEILEADDFLHLPETAFLRGFVRSYARILQLDPVPLLAALPHSTVENIQPVVETHPQNPYPSFLSERKKQNIIWLAGAFLVFVALAFVVWQFGDKPQNLKEQKELNPAKEILSEAQTGMIGATKSPIVSPTSSVSETTPVAMGSNPVIMGGNSMGTNPVAPSAIQEAAEVKVAEVKSAPVVAPAAVSPVIKPASGLVAKPVATNTPPADNTPGHGVIRMTFDADAWVEIKDKNNRILMSQLNRAGAEQSVSGSPPFSLVVGHSKSVHMYYKGQPVDLAQHTQIAVARLTLE